MHTITKPLSIVSLALASTCCGDEPVDASKAVAPYIAHYATEPPTIDGAVTEPIWEIAPAITTFNLYRPVDVEQLPTTSVKLLWDRTHLYLAFDCGDDDIWSYSDKNDEPLYQGDVVELFVKPSRDALSYYEFVVAPNGAIFDARYPSRGAGLSHRFGRWNSEAQIATRLHGTDDNYCDSDRGYTVEMAIPFKAFEPQQRPVKGSEWTFGVFRYDYSKSYEDCLMLMSISKSSENHGFHHYEGYAPLQFND